jgi:hemolysin-activating ACP:hemolysin acyltransferase
MVVIARNPELIEGDEAISNSNEEVGSNLYILHKILTFGEE